MVGAIKGRGSVRMGPESGVCNYKLRMFDGMTPYVSVRGRM